MFLEIGGKFSYQGGKYTFFNNYIETCWDSMDNKPSVDLPPEFKQDWHIHPWECCWTWSTKFF